jgi:glycosyltransferase involved in cell wall biosynthesis
MPAYKYKILVIHNAYQQRGGEDSVVESEIALLRAHGHEVATYFRSNDDIATMPALSVAVNTLWSSGAADDLSQLIRSFQPDVIHVHNTLPLISPAIYWAAEHAGVPVVQTLHNFRLMCLNALYLREGKVCEDCVGHLPWRGVLHQCYRGSAAASAVLASSLALHRSLGTYRKKVSRYIALNEFCKNKFIEGGLPAELIAVKPNFVDAPLPLDLPRKGILFVGRLSVEKGVESLAKAATLLADAQLRVAGEGPQAELLDGVPSAVKLGRLSSEAVRHEMNSALALVIPSVWYETFGMVIVEAFASGTPVIASRIGALADIVAEGETGLLFKPGDAKDMADKLSWALNHPEQMAEMGHKARAKYEAEFTAEQNYLQLIKIYKDVVIEPKSCRLISRY